MFTTTSVKRETAIGRDGRTSRFDGPACQALVDSHDWRELVIDDASPGQEQEGEARRKQAQTQEFVKYQQQVMKNMVAMVDRLKEHGVKIVSEGTDNHLVLCDLRPFGVDGSRVERVLELAHIACNKNTVPGDKSALVPGGLRLGTPALTTRGFTEEDFVKVADYIKKGIDISVEISKEVEGKKFGDFKKVLESKEFPAIAALKKEVESLAEEFPTIGFDKAEGKYTK